LERSIKQRERRGWARSGMGANGRLRKDRFGAEIVKNCGSLGTNPADRIPSRPKAVNRTDELAGS
jgi:hypothetical protein